MEKITISVKAEALCLFGFFSSFIESALLFMSKDNFIKLLTFYSNKENRKFDSNDKMFGHIGKNGVISVSGVLSDFKDLIKNAKWLWENKYFSEAEPALRALFNEVCESLANDENSIHYHGITSNGSMFLEEAKKVDIKDYNALSVFIEKPSEYYWKINSRIEDEIRDFDEGFPK